MTPVYDDGFAALYCGDVLATLAEMPAGSAQTCVTSPPYWGLRDYGTATWEGGAEDCPHVAGTAASARSTLKNDGRPNPGSNNYERSVVVPYRDACGKCGARRIDAQLGLEATPAEYVDRMVAVFREVWRVLRDDGTLWLNLGDSYNAYNGNRGTASPYAGNRAEREPMFPTGHGLAAPDLKPKDLVGIPWRVALALQADGWTLRSDIIWSKPNPMPESVTDRPTKAHEYLFLLTKRERYFYDADAIREPLTESSVERGKYPHRSASAGRNKRTVWTVATEPYAEAHFATFPPKLIEPCILAGSPEGGVVLEPFAGSGTTLAVAKGLGRRSVGIELNPEYCALAARRIQAVTLPMFAGVSP